MLYFFLFGLSLFFLIKSADVATRYATDLSDNLKISQYVMGFILVAIISMLPEGIISIVSAIEAQPAFGLGTLIGSNVADLTLVFAIVVLISSHPIKVESKIIKNGPLYILALVMPILLGFQGHYSRMDGILLILSGLTFYYFILRRQPVEEQNVLDSLIPRRFPWKSFIFLVISMAILLFAAHYTVKFGILLAHQLHIHPILIAMFFVGLSTTLPELFFSIKAVRKNYDDLASGDVLGTVMNDATILVGVLALIRPFSFNPKIIYVTGMAMVLAAVLLLYFMRTEKVLTKKEGIWLLFFYLAFVFVEWTIGHHF